MTILVEARHIIRPITSRAFDAYVEFYGNDALPAMARSGFELVGAWKRSGGAMGQDVTLYRFDSLAHYERAQARLAADSALGGAIGKMLGSVEMAETTKLGSPLGEAAGRGFEHARAVAPPAPRLYRQVVTKLVFSGQARALELLEELAVRAPEKGLGRVVASYQTVTGPGPEATQLWLLPDAAAPLTYTQGDPLASLVEPLREVAPEEEVYWLSPLPYSPLQ